MPQSPDITCPIVCILAGGQSTRMGGIDKAIITIHGERMIDVVINRLRPQAGFIVISGPDDKATGLTCLPDDPAGPRGPTAALWSVCKWMNHYHPDATGFYTVPVDAPLFPSDLIARLTNPNVCTIARDTTSTHPTFAYWDTQILRSAFDKIGPGQNPAIHRLAEFCNAKQVLFGAGAFTNINTPADLERVEHKTGSP